VGRLASDPPGSELPALRVWGCRTRSNLPSERLNDGDILGQVLTVAVEHPASDIGAISTNEVVTKDIGVRIVVSETSCGRPETGLVGRALGGVPGARLAQGGPR